MKLWQAGAIFFACFLAFFPYFFFRVDLIGVDAYFFFSQVCKKTEFSEFFSQPIGAQIVFSLMPCSFFAAKLLLFACLFAGVLGIAFLGKVFDEKNGWRAGLFAFLSPLLVFEFAKFENDALAFPFLFWAAYFFYSSGLKNKFIACVLGGIALLFWYPSLLFLVGLFLGSAIVLPFFFALLIKIEAVLSFLFDSCNVLEMQSLKGVLYFFLLSAGYLGALNSGLLLQTLFFTVLAVLRFKLAFLTVPFLAVGLSCFFLNARNRVQCRRKAFVSGFFAVLGLGLALCWGVCLLFQPPFESDWQAIDFALEQASLCGLPLKNHWDFGYWVGFKGVFPSAYAGVGAVQDYNGSIVLTSSASSLPCTLLKDFLTAKVWKC